MSLKAVQKVVEGQQVEAGPAAWPDVVVAGHWLVAARLEDGGGTAPVHRAIIDQ